jgi:hypothetical protein
VSVFFPLNHIDFIFLVKLLKFCMFSIWKPGSQKKFQQRTIMFWEYYVFATKNPLCRFLNRVYIYAYWSRYQLIYCLLSLRNSVLKYHNHIDFIFLVKLLKFCMFSIWKPGSQKKFQYVAIYMILPFITMYPVIYMLFYEMH